MMSATKYNNEVVRSPLILLILISILIIATLLMVAYYFVRPTIESELKYEIRSDLDNNGLQNTNIIISGRDVVVSGSSEASTAAAKKVVEDVRGVRKVKTAD